ncbi:hypothetical protein [Paenarthrobacter sp. 22069]|uniref:hypothetical protein n=1 Tax=Paenarthrobacter sp. 22069 TaxID=3453864 RepID=UPI003F8259CF
MTLPVVGTRRRVLAGCFALAAAAAMLSGCATNSNGLQREVATQLQARVLEITQASSQNDPASALRALDGLEADLSAAQAKGKVSEERRRSITTVATAVRADLKDAIEAQQAAATKAAEDARIAAGQAASQSPSPAPEPTSAQPAPAPDPGNASGNGADAGKGNNGDKGKGKN